MTDPLQEARRLSERFPSVSEMPTRARIRWYLRGADAVMEYNRHQEELRTLAQRVEDAERRADEAETEADRQGGLAEQAERENERLRKLASDIARADGWWLIRFARERARQALRQEEA